MSSRSTVAMLSPTVNAAMMHPPSGSNLVFIDTTVPDYPQLIAGVIAGNEVYVLDAQTDAITQITEVLQGQSGVSSIHIVSHGEAGELHFGSGVVDSAALSNYAAQLQSWQNALLNGADILLYGCNVAKGDAGKAFVSLFSELTGADIAASSNLTGSSTLGGDWKLEVKTGRVKATVPFSTQATEAYANVLDIKVAVVVQPGDNSTGFIDIVHQLNNDTYFDFTATLVNSSQVDTAAELNAYNTVIIGNSGDSTGFMDSTFASALRSWVESGGGLVSVGWIVYGDLGNPNIDAVVPVNTVSSHNAFFNPTVVPNGVNHPVITGVSSFLSTDYSETPVGGIDQGATILATVNGQPAVVVANKGSGKSAYLGPIYSGGFYYNTTGLRSGSADRLLEQAVAWVATPTNVAPSVTLTGSTVAYTENAAATLLNTGATVTDTDSPNFDTGNLTVNIQSGATADDRLAIRNEGLAPGQIGVVSNNGVVFGGLQIGTFSGGTGTTPLVVTFNPAATPAAVQALLSNITYSNVSEAPSTASRTVQFLVSDGDGGTSTAVVRFVNVTTVNDTPVNAIPGAQIINEDIPLVFSATNGNAISISDLDAGTNPVQVTLTGTNGTFSLSGINGLSFTAGDGTADGTMTFTGTLANINTALNGLSFRPTDNFNGAASLALTTNDQGFSGGGALTDSDTINITVNSINDAPTLSGGNDADRVAILGAPGGDPTWLNDVVAKVQSTGLFTTVDSFNVSSVTPTLAQLQTYDSVLVFSNAPFADATTLGNNLADYVDAGGGVVVNTFALAEFYFSGRWATGDYNPLLSGSTSSQAQSTLGTIFDPNHPVLQGVTSFNGGSSSFYNTGGTVNPNATVVANWSSNAPLVIDLQSFNGGIVGLNFFAPSSDARPDFWTASTDGEWLMGNALEYVDGTGTSGIEATATEDDASFTVDLLAGATDADGDTLNVSNLALTGGSAAGVTVNGNSLSINPNAYNSLAAGAKETITYTYNIVDGNNGSVAQTATVTINGIDDAPTAANLANTTSSLNENTDTTAAIKVADINITDVDGGNNLTLSGADAADFTIINNALYLKAGVALNFEGKSSYSVNVVVDAPGVGQNPDFTLPFTLTVTDVNEAPTVASLTDPVTTLAENTNTTNPVKVADITITDDALGTENLTLTGADASSFTIINGGLYIKAGEVLNFEAKSSYNVNVVVDDPTVGSTPDFTLPFSLTLTDVNEVPAAASLATTVTTLAENTPINSPLKVANINITDDALGTENLTLTGADAGSFSIVGTELFLNAGVTLNFETKSSYNVNVVVDDTTVGSTPDFTLPFVLTVTDVNEVPTAATLANPVTTLAENTNTSNPIKVADITITDDALGAENLTLTGADAASFTIINGGLYIKAGEVLNFEAKSSYNVNVVIDDPTVGATPDFNLPFTLTLTDVNEAPTALALTNQINTLGENTSTTNAVKVADITFTDDALGTNTLSLSGADANSFTISNNGLFIKSGVTLDFETKSTYNVTVNVDDTTIGSTPDASQAFTLTLTDLNDAPVLIDTVVTLGTSRANAGAPAGAVGTLVSQLVGFASGTGQKNVTDGDAGAKLGVAITATNSLNGTWFYSINNGTNWNSLGSVSDSSARLLAADANTRLYFQANPGYTGSIANAITFRAWDQTGGTTNGSVASTSSNGNPTPFSTATDTASLEVRPQGFDFNGDGNVDIFWRNSSTGDLGFWSMNGATVAQSGSLGNSQPSNGWTPITAGDLTGDGKADILWQNRSTGQNAVWEMNGTTFSKSTLILSTPANSGWEAVGVGDFTGDGKNDLLWRERNTGDNGIWEMNGTTFVKAQLLAPISASSGWEAVGVGDFTKDGKDDILWRNRNTGDNGIWEMNGTTFVKAQTIDPIAPESGWRVAGVADYNKDGNADILWRNSISGQDGIWTMNGSTRTGILGLTPDVAPSSGWNIVGANY